jgi:hypothetical protein
LVLDYDERIFRSFIIAKNRTKNNELRMALAVFDKRKDERFDVLSEILEIMRMRHALAERVYYHKTKAIATSMLISISMAVEDFPKDTNPYEHPNNSILNFTDAKLFKFLEDNCQDENKNKLLKMLITRNLYKVGGIIPYRLALPEDIDSIFVKPYHDDPEQEKRKELENKIKINNEAIVYCPPQHPQAKEIQTFIQTSELEYALPLNRMQEELSIKDEVKLLSKDKYEHLWKFFLLLHPEDVKNKIIISKVVHNFCKFVMPDRHGLKFLNDKKFVRHKDYKPIAELRKDLLNEWRQIADDGLNEKHGQSLKPFLNKKDSLINPYILHQLEDIISHDEKWKEYEHHEFISKEEYFKVFDKIWYELFVQKPIKNFNHVHKQKFSNIGNNPERIQEFKQSFKDAVIQCEARGSADSHDHEIFQIAEDFVIDKFKNEENK